MLGKGTKEILNIALQYGSKKISKGVAFLRFLIALFVLLPGIVSCSLQDESSLLEPPAGKKLVHKTDQGKEIFLFCPEFVTVEFKNSVYRPHMRRGTWKKEGDHIKITWQREYGGQGLGEPIGDCSVECRYPSYKKFSKSIEESYSLDWNYIQEHPFGDWAISDHPMECRVSLQ